MTALLSGVVGLRLTADAVLELWSRDDCQGAGDRSAARREVLTSTARVTGWYADLAVSLLGGKDVPPPLERDAAGDQRLVDLLRRDFVSADGTSSATAVRMIWTGDHLDAARRLQGLLVAPAWAAAEQLRLGPSFR